MKRNAMLLLLPLAFAAPVFANDDGFFVAANVGLVGFNNSPALLGSTLRISGGYDFNPYIGVEAGYAHGEGTTKTTFSGFGTSWSDTDTMKYSASHVAAIVTYPFSTRFGIYAKLGVANTALDYTFSSTRGDTGSGSAKKSNPMLGIGWRYNFGQNFGLRVQYDDYGKTALTANYSNQPSQTYNVGVQVFSVGVAYNF
jgi:opacity protein-like surface antigen